MSKLPCSREYVDLVEGTFTVADTQNPGSASKPPSRLRRLSHHAKRKSHFLLHGRRARGGLERQEHGHAGEGCRFLHRRFAVHAGRIARYSRLGTQQLETSDRNRRFRPAPNVSHFTITIRTTRMATSKKFSQSARKICSQRDCSARRTRNHSVVNSEHMPVKFRDYYEILGVSRTAKEDEIKKVVPKARAQIPSGPESQQQAIRREIQRNPGSLRGSERPGKAQEIRSARSELEKRRGLHASSELGRRRPAADSRARSIWKICSVAPSSSAADRSVISSRPFSAEWAAWGHGRRRDRQADATGGRAREGRGI